MYALIFGSGVHGAVKQKQQDGLLSGMIYNLLMKKSRGRSSWRVTLFCCKMVAYPLSMLIPATCNKAPARLAGFSPAVYGVVAASWCVCVETVIGILSKITAFQQPSFGLYVVFFLNLCGAVLTLGLLAADFYQHYMIVHRKWKPPIPHKYVGYRAHFSGIKFGLFFFILLKVCEAIKKAI